METKNNNQHKQQADDFIRLQDLWGMFLPKWHWFVGSLCITIAIATLYIMITPPLYTRTASILVKDNGKNGGSSSGPSEIQDLGIFKNNTNINNELLTLQSPTLMTEVVKRLKLDDTYCIDEGLRTKELYKQTPVLVTFTHPEQAEEATFKIEAKSNHTYILYGFENQGNETLTVEAGKPVQTPLGELSLTATRHANSSWVGRPITFTKSNLKETTDDYTKALKAELGNEDATIINLTIDDPSIQKAEDILSTLIAVYNENWIQDKNQIAVSTSHFINDRLGIIENELGTVDQNISSYKSANLLPDVQAAANQYMTQSAENKKELLTLNSQLSTAQFIRRELQRKDTKQPLPTNTGIDNVNLQSQISEYNTMLLDRNRLLENSSDKNPLVQDLNKSLHSMQSGIIQSVDNVITAINMQMANLKTQESATVSRLASNPQQAKHLLSVERQQKVKEELYLYLLQKREENELNQAFTAYNTRVITAPRGSAFATAPRKISIYLVALAIGLLLSAVLIFVIENANTKVRGRKDLEALTLPFVGEIPLTREERAHQRKSLLKWKTKANRKEETHPIVVKEKNRNMVNEAFRVVRTNLEFMASTDVPHKVIMLTSANPASGKTFITANLATSLAIKDKHVVVIDLDMRRASLSSYVDSPEVGISNYLSGQNTMDDIIVKGSIHPSLDLIPVGTIPPNPTELLFNKRLKELIDTLRTRYDYVFIDCPPIEIVADTSIIGKWADMTLFVIRAELMEREMLSEIEALYTDKKYNSMAVLLNGTVSAYGGKYGYHKYGYRYGYHYGYGSYGSKNS